MRKPTPARLTPEQALDWVNWFVQNDDTIEFAEEDGGLIMWVRKGDCSWTYIGGAPVECIEQAAHEHSAPV